MKRQNQTLTTIEDLLVDLTFHNFPSSLLREFAQKIVNPYFHGNLNAAVQDLIQKALADQDFVLSHTTHIRNPEAKMHG